MLPTLTPYLADKTLSKYEFNQYLKITKSLIQ